MLASFMLSLQIFIVFLIDQSLLVSNLVRLDVQAFAHNVSDLCSISFPIFLLSEFQVAWIIDSAIMHSNSIKKLAIHHEEDRWQVQYVICRSETALRVFNAQDSHRSKRTERSFLKRNDVFTIGCCSFWEDQDWRNRLASHAVIHSLLDIMQHGVFLISISTINEQTLTSSGDRSNKWYVSNASFRKEARNVSGLQEIEDIKE